MYDTVSRAIPVNGRATKRPGEMAELYRKSERKRSDEPREGFDASESLARRRGGIAGYSEERESSGEDCRVFLGGGWTIAKRRNIERAHYES